MVFATKLIERQTTLDKCRPLFEDPRFRENLRKLMELLRPPVKEVTIGVEPNAVKVGGKDVVYRHEWTWRNPTAIALDVHDGMGDEEVERRIKFVNEWFYERIEKRLGIDLLAVRCVSGSAERFVKFVEKVCKLTSKPLIVCTLDPATLEEVLKRIGSRRPLIYAATERNWREFADLAVKWSCPLVVSAPNDLSKLKSLVVSIVKNFGYEELVLDPGTLVSNGGFLDTISNFTALRYSAIEFGEREVGFPLMAIPATVWIFESGGTEELEFREAIIACSLVARYADILVMHSLSPWVYMAVLCLRDCLYTDPRVPPSVKPGLYEVGKPTPESPLVVTCNYALTVSLVRGDLEKSGIDAWLLVIDTEGTSVASAVAGKRFTADKIAEAVKELKLEEKVKHRSLVIPGYAAKIAGELEDLLPGWRVFVGPRESSDLPKFIREIWSKEVLGKA